MILAHARMSHASNSWEIVWLEGLKTKAVKRRVKLLVVSTVHAVQCDKLRSLSVQSVR